eukprot:12948603-Heterocapsa_arctica.AAC.1
MEDLLDGQQSIVFMADARGLAPILRLGIYRGSETMCPIDLALSEEIAFGISTQVGPDGNVGDEFWALDHCYGHVRFTGQIGVIVSVPRLLEEE